MDNRADGNGSGLADSRLLVGIVTVVAMAAYVLLPAAAADTFFQVIAWGSIITMIVGIRRNGGFTLPWVFITVGWTMTATGDLLFSLYDHVLDEAPFPGPADVFSLLGYPFLATGLAALVRRSRPDGDRIALIDASIVLVPLAVAAWIYVIEPYASGGGSTVGEQAVSGAYPLGDLLCLAVLIRLFAGPPLARRSAQPAMSYLGLGLFVMLAGDIWFVITQLHDTYSPSRISDSLYLVPYIGFAAAALSPSVGRIGQELPKTDPSLGLRRLTLLAIAALVTPSILVIEYLLHDDLAVPLIVCGTAISFLLVIARMASLVEAMENSRAELAYDATHDHLTGLVNRSLFARQIESSITRSPVGSLLFIDLDNFKRVNDEFGHHEGDQTLIRVSDRLRSSVRATDLVARLSGDEFGVPLPGADESVAEVLAGRLVEQLSMSVADSSVLITASIGSISWSPERRAQSAQSLLVQAMYRAKAADGNHYFMADAS